MSNDLTGKKRTEAAAPGEQPKDAASRLKGALMQDALGRMFGKDDEKPPVPGNPRVILALANHGRSPGWDRAKVLQREMFKAGGGRLAMKFCFFGADDAAGNRRCRITTRWIADPDDMDGVMERAECSCGCYVQIRDVLAQAVKENEARPMRAVIIVGDAFHDNADGLTEAALYASQLRRAGTRVFLIQNGDGDDPSTTHRLRYIAKLSGATHFQFDPRTQGRQFAEMMETISVFASSGEEAVKAKGGETANLLLEHLRQEPMPIIEERERARVDRDNIKE
jgi:hypothetical protein